MTLCVAQQEASNWYFGQNAGLKFNATDGSVAAVTNGQINTLEGCTSISSTDGRLLFYSDGQTVWNANHNIMPNGDYFGGTGLLGDPSSTSSGLIVPKPQNDSKFYLFTVDEPHHDNANAYPAQFTGGGVVPGQDDGFNNGFNYSLIDMDLQGGLGDVDATEKNIPLISYDPSDPEAIKYKCSEKITAVKADDCSSFWVITHFVDTYYAFKVDIDGVETTPVTSKVGPVVPISGYRRNALGYLKASPDGTKLVVAHFGFGNIQAGDAPGGVYLMGFDNETGIVSNSVELYGPSNNDSPYGVEFSAENKKVYATVDAGISGNGPSSLFQWDLESANIPASIQTVHQSSFISAGALQLGLDKRIYRAQFSFGGGSDTDRYLGIINNPEASGSATNYNERGVLLDVNGGFRNTGRIGLPPFIQSLFNSQIDIIQNNQSSTELKLCDGDGYTLTAENIPGGNYTWTKDGALLAETTFELFVDSPGFYEVFIEPNNGECPIEGNAVVGVFDVPVATKPSNLVVCSPTDTASVDLTVKNAAILSGQDPLDFDVNFFTSEENAKDNINPIMGDFSTTENPQAIFARVENINNPNCFDITSFEIEVFLQPIIDNLPDITICDASKDGNTFDGIDTFNLNTLNPNILGAQDDPLFSISFHESQADADANDAALLVSFTNTDPFSQELFARIENTNNTDCYSTDSFILNINPTPIANDITIVQCDEDGNPNGLTTYDLTDYSNGITGGIADRTVSFYELMTDLEAENNEIDGKAFNNLSNPQTLFALVTNTQTGCANVAEVTLETSSTASNDARLEACDDDGIEDGFYSFDLTDAESDILLGLPAGLDLAYYESYDEALTEDNPLPTSYTNTIPNLQTIFARVENANACFGISRIELTVFELPQLLVQKDIFYCLNTFPQTIAIDGGIVNDNPSNYLYDWFTGETTASIDVNTPGNYTVTVTSNEGCVKNRTVNVLPSNIATFTDIEVTDASSNNTISVFVSGEGSYQYALDDPSGPYQDSPLFENVRFGLHTVYVKDIKNDCGIVEEVVSVIGFPKYFTPNGDGFNDSWQVQGISEEFQPNTKILIFDRYGKLIKELNPLGLGWDGTFNGSPMRTNDYWFVVKLQDGRTLKGHFTLKR